jgi:hypothetical protein
LINTLDKPPADNAGHHWADYAELLCLANVDGEISRKDLENRHAYLADLSMAVDQAEDVDWRGDLDPAAPVGEGDVTSETNGVDVFRHLSYRTGAFAEAYPFQLSDDGEVLSRRKGDLILGQQLYVFLLCASSLRCVRIRDRDEVTKGFERLAADAVRRWLPDHAQVHVFGTAAVHGERYYGSKETKLARLAEDLHEDLILTGAELAKGDLGDYGADTAAWIPFDDGNKNFLVLLGQATCQVKWEDKQQQSAYDKWKNVMNFATHTNNAMIVPFCFRDPTGAWYDRLMIYGTIFFDRVRLLALLKDDLEDEIPSVPYGLVRAALEYREEV